MISKSEAMDANNQWIPGYPDPYPSYPLPHIPTYPSTTTFIQRETKVTSPELYADDLDVLKTLMARLPTLAGIEGVTEIEIRVRMHDENSWAVIGYGEAGDPCVIRFES